MVLLLLYRVYTVTFFFFFLFCKCVGMWVPREREKDQQPVWSALRNLITLKDACRASDTYLPPPPPQKARGSRNLSPPPLHL